MAGRVNLVGQKFGRLTVVELLPERTKYRARIYRCRCECGNYRDVVSQMLTSGDATQCIECGKTNRKPSKTYKPRESKTQEPPKRMGRKQTYPDPEPGQVINEWTVLGPCESDEHGNARWLCRCVCGEEQKLIRHIIYKKKNCGHERRADTLKGKHFGRLEIMHTVLQKGPNCAQLALFRCDCGGVRLARVSSVKYGLVKSCGCLLNWKHAGKARCPACGHAFPVTLDGTPTPQFCPDCAPKYAGRNWRVCPICKKLFAAPPSDKTVTCSKACSSAWRAQMQRGIHRDWSEESRARVRAKGWTDNLRLGTEAARLSPVAGRFETNQMAKIWTLVDPTGQEYVVRNLALWARENAALFGKEPGDKAGEQISHGFIALAQTLRGTRKYPARSYFGWTLKEAPRDPDEDGAEGSEEEL